MIGLKAERISVAIEGKTILDGASLSLKRGEMVGLIGPNGAGKSTLIKAILGLVETSTGAITLEGEDVPSMTDRDRARRMAYSAQGAPVYWPLSVERLVALGRIPHLDPWQKLRDADRRQIERALELTDCRHLRHQSVTTLSGGERARVLLARAFATDAPYLLADEPTASLDPFHQLKVMDLLKAHAHEEGGASLVVLHDLGLAARYCDRLVLLDQGRLVAEGKARDVLTPANMAQVFQVDAHWGPDGDSAHLAICPLEGKDHGGKPS